MAYICKKRKNGDEENDANPDFLLNRKRIYVSQQIIALPE